MFRNGTGKLVNFLLTNPAKRKGVESPMASSHLRPVWRMFMVTDLRRQELCSLKFSDVDLERKTVTVSADHAKCKKAREIPRDDAMLQEIDSLRKAARARRPVDGRTAKQTEQQRKAFTEDHVFVTQANTPLGNNLLKRFYKYAQKARIEDACEGGMVDIHSLRVSFTTLLLENGASPKAVQAILGHSTLALTMGVYARASDKSKRDAINVLPFASTSNPEHIISLQNAPRAPTSSIDTPETGVG